MKATYVYTVIFQVSNPRFRGLAATGLKDDLPAFLASHLSGFIAEQLNPGFTIELLAGSITEVPGPHP